MNNTIETAAGRQLRLMDVTIAEIERVGLSAEAMDDDIEAVICDGITHQELLLDYLANARGNDEVSAWLDYVDAVFRIVKEEKKRQPCAL